MKNPKDAPRKLNLMGVKIAILLENDRIHYAKLIQQFLEKNTNRLKLFFYQHMVQASI